ncbi:MAG: hypothetical protein ACI89R_000758 [Candidatus Azotimanducaceae bacterium]|jgi:hypothetical protein
MIYSGELVKFNHKVVLKHRKEKHPKKFMGPKFFTSKEKMLQQ